MGSDLGWPIVGITGAARSGKDTAAEYIVNAFGGWRYAFADPMRAMLAAGLDLNIHSVHWDELKETPIERLNGATPRRLMQTLGTEWGRSYFPGIWVAQAKRRYAICGSGMVISDVRFDDEAKWIHSAGGIVIAIERPDAVKVAAHRSEDGIDPTLINFTVVNDGTIEELYVALFDVITSGQTTI